VRFAELNLFRRLPRSDFGDDAGGVACPDRTAPGGGPFRSAEARLASGAVRVRLLHDCALLIVHLVRALRGADVER